ncbi:MAG: hypothetical protein K6F00_04060, partial [Lachnospiraceae bacterium]|nr:hypothetical protein [Lachnospiraceae bacterium]
KTEGTELYIKKANYAAMKKAELKERENRDVEASIRRKVSVDVKKKVGFAMSRELSIVTNVLYGDKMEGILANYQKIINDYSLKKPESTDELLSMLEDKIMKVEFSKFDLSDESRIAENAEYLDSVTRMVRAYDKVLKDSEKVLGDKFKNRSKLLADKLNAKLGDDDVKLSEDAFSGKLEKLRDLCSLYRVKKMIMKNPYYAEHLNSEVSSFISKDSNIDQVYLSKLLRTSNYLAKNVCYSNNIKDYKFNDDLSKDGDEMDRVKEAELAFVSKDGLDYCKEGSQDNPETLRIKGSIDKYRKILSKIDDKVLSTEDFYIYVQVIEKYEMLKRKEDERIKNGEKIPEEEKLKPLPLGSVSEHTIYNVTYKQRTGKYRDKNDSNRIKDSKVDDIIGKVPEIKALIKQYVTEEMQKKENDLKAEKEKLKNRALNNDRVAMTEKILNSLEMESLKCTKDEYRFDLNTIENKKIDGLMSHYSRSAYSVDRGMEITEAIESKRGNKKNVTAFVDKLKVIRGNEHAFGIVSPKFGSVMKSCGENLSRFDCALASSAYSSKTEEELLEIYENIVLAQTKKDITNTESYKKAVENENLEREKAKREKRKRSDKIIPDKAKICEDVEKNRENGFDDEFVSYVEDAFMESYYDLLVALNGEMGSMANSMGDSFIHAHAMDRSKFIDKNTYKMYLLNMTVATNFTNHPFLKFIKKFTDKDTEQIEDFTAVTGMLSTQTFVTGKYGEYLSGAHYKEEDKRKVYLKKRIDKLEKLIKEKETELNNRNITEEEAMPLQEELNDIKIEKEVIGYALKSNAIKSLNYVEEGIKDSYFASDSIYSEPEEKDNSLSDYMEDSLQTNFDTKFKTGFDEYRKVNPHIQKTKQEDIEKYNARLKKRGLKRHEVIDQEYNTVEEEYQANAGNEFRAYFKGELELDEQLKAAK